MGETSARAIGSALRIGAAGVLAAWLLGCGGPALDRADVAVGELTFRVEVARTERQQHKGLSGRTTISPGSGMLFDFSRRGVQKVWMADMKVPLDVAWLADDAVVAVRTLQPCPTTATDCPTWTAPAPVDALLEVPAGALSGVSPGTSVRVRDVEK